MQRSGSAAPVASILARRRTLGLVVIVSLALLAVVGCGQPAAPPAAAPQAKPQAPAPAAPAPAPPAPAAAKAPSAPAKPATVEKLKVTQPVGSLSFLTAYVARGNGFFKDEGFDVEVTVMGRGGPEVQALIAGDVDFSFTATSVVMQAQQQGQKVISVQNMLGRNIINLAMHKDVAKRLGVTPESPFKAKLAALKGLKIGASGPGSLSYQMAAYFIQKAGLVNQKDVEIIGVGQGAPSIAALEQKKVDAIVFSTPIPEQAVNMGLAVMLVDNTKGEDPDLKDFQQQVLAVRPDWADKNQDKVRRVARALTRANQWVSQSNPDVVAKAVQPFFKDIDAGVLKDSVATVQRAVVPDGKISSAGVLNVQKWLQLVGGLKDIIPPEKLYTNQYLTGS